MIKWISSILIILLGIVISIILYLSTVGIETKSFNNLIENKVKNYNQNLLLKFDKVQLLLDPKKLDLKIIDKNKKETISKLTKGGVYYREKGVEHNVFNNNNFPYSFIEVELIN